MYGATQFDRATIDALAAQFDAALRALAAACRARVAERGAGATPGDYPLARAAGLTQEALDRLPFDARAIDDIYPLSPMQQGILFHSLFAPERATYVNQLVATLVDPDVERLRGAFDAAVPRHDILRTGFAAHEAKPMQIVHRHARMPIEIVDWRGAHASAGALDAALDACSRAGFAGQHVAIRNILNAYPVLARERMRRRRDGKQRIPAEHHRVERRGVIGALDEAKLAFVS